MKKTLSLTAFLLLTFCCYAQKQNLVITITDSLDQKPLANATLAILSKKDSSLIIFGIADTTGTCYFRNIDPRKAACLLVSATGHQEKRIALPLTSEKEQKMAIPLSPDFSRLEEIVVRHNASPVRLFKDTLEFDPSFFKTEENAVLEKLLKKLPGIEVRPNGEVYANGQRVSRILIDGKEFFSSDPLVILKNLPVEIIDKVQLADEKYTIAKETRLKKDIPKVINLKLKKKIKKGIFGKVFGGYGTDSRYEAGGLINMFQDTLQVSLLGSSSNQGRNSFSMQDLNDIGGFGRSEGMGGQSSWSLDNDMGRGIQTKSLAGTNINYNFGPNIQFNTQYFYKSNRNYTNGQTHGVQFIGDSSLLFDYNYDQHELNRSHTISSGLRSKQDSTGYFTAQFEASWSDNNSENNTTGLNYSSHVAFLSQSTTYRQNQNNTSNLKGSVNYSKTFVKRHIDWSFDASYSGQPSTNNNKNNTLYKAGLTANNDSVLQYISNREPQKQFSISQNLNKNIGEKQQIDWNTSYKYSTVQRGPVIMQYQPQKGDYEFDPSLSGILHQQRQLLGTSAKYVYFNKSLNLQLGVDYKYLLTRNDYSIINTPSGHQQTGLLSPAASLSYKNFTLSFSRNLEFVTPWYLSPVKDSSNPLSINYGNPDLKPLKTSNLSLNYSKYFTKPQINVSVQLSGVRSQNAVIFQRTIIANGMSTSGPVNVDKKDGLNGNINLSKSFYKNNWNYSIALSSGGNFDNQPIILNSLTINNKSSQLYGGAFGMLAWKDAFRWEPSFNYNLYSSHSQDSTMPSTHAYTQRFASRFYVKLHRRLSFDTNITLNSNPGAAPGYKKEWLFCDAALTWTFLKKKQAQIKLSGYDLLNQNEGLFRYTTMNYVFDSKSLVQKRYFMMTLIYSFKKF